MNNNIIIMNAYECMIALRYTSALLERFKRLFFESSKHGIGLQFMMVMMIFHGSCWSWPPRVSPYVVLWSWTFTTDGIAPEGNPLLASISCLSRHPGEHSGSILFTPKVQEACER